MPPPPPPQVFKQVTYAAGHTWKDPLSPIVNKHGSESKQSRINCLLSSSLSQEKLNVRASSF